MINMHKKFILCFLYVATAIIAVSCDKDPLTDGLLGTTWIPIHAVGGIEGPNYTIIWDDVIDENGALTVRYEHNGETIEYTMLFDGYKFYKKGKEKVFSTFSLTHPDVISTPHGYYIKDNRIYLERVVPSGNPWTSSIGEDDSKTKYSSSALVELSADRMTFDGITYKRTN